MKAAEKVKLAVLVLLIIGGVALYFTTGLNTVSPAEAVEWFRGLGAWAGLVFILLYTMLPVLFVPGSILTLIAGVLFGPLLGTLYVIVGANLGAAAAFLAARYFGHALKDRLEKVRFMNIAEANKKIERNGFLFVLFLRLVPIFPYNGLNYGLALTRIRFRDYILGSIVGMVPAIFAFVYLGSSLAELDATKIAIALLLVALIIGIPTYIKRRHANKLKKAGIKE